MQHTALKYMDNQYLYEDTAQFLESIEHPDERRSWVLDQTILYPQGGGQPWDTGSIEGANGRLTVTEVRFTDGIVHHFGEIQGDFSPGETVRLRVDQSRRHLNSRLHSAGHLIDEAVKSLGLTWHPTKGIHFPDQAGVEYEGGLNGIDDWAPKIETELNRLVAQGFETRAFLAPREKLAELCHFVLPNMPLDKPSRVVVVWGDKGIPCGGTHVQNINEIGPVSIRYVKEKKGVLKIGYAL